jgi:thiol-disulfide isomerase/thioredoxin
LWRARTPRCNIWIGAVLLPLAIAFAAVGARLPADSFVTGISDGVSLEDLPVEDFPGSIMDGSQLIVLVNEDCTPCEAAIPHLNQLARERKDLAITALFSGSRQEATAWRLANLPAFRVAHASPRALRIYYRKLPSCFLLRDGRVAEAWWGRIPNAVEVERMLAGAQVAPVGG